MNNVAFFEIQTVNPERALHFYSSIFDWTFSKQEGLPIPYWQIKTPGINGGLLERPGTSFPSENGTNAFTCSIQVEDFDAVAQKIIETGGTIALEKFHVPGKCWQGYFHDTEMNIFGIFEVDETRQ